MARIHIESGDELPDLGALLRPKQVSKRAPVTGRRTKEGTDAASAREEKIANTGRQRVLKKVENNAKLLGRFDGSEDSESLRSLSRSESRSPRKQVKRSKPIDVFQDENRAVDDEFNCGDSDKDESYHFSANEGSEDERSWLPRNKNLSPLQKLLSARKKQSTDFANAHMPLSAKLDFDNPFLGPRTDACALPPPQSQSPKFSRPTSSSSAMDRNAILHYTPPKRLSPKKLAASQRSETPPPEDPPSPSKRLSSPSKARFANIPKAPVRESLDAFWSQDVINDWNEQYSPKKMVASPRKNRFLASTPSDDDEPPSPSTSPRKRSPQKSPVKSREAREAKKTWEQSKVKIAEDFLKELDDTITEGKLAELTADTGGVAIVWSKKLNTTAGKATWKRVSHKHTKSDGSVEKTYKHTAYIELAEKVVDDETRLINVVAHEFCHLCNFMIHGLTGNPHGKEFKGWAKKVSRAFSDRGIEVTTKHTYDIEYKYIWACKECGVEYKRHSKSIDTTKSRCGAGSCKGTLLQIKPAPREAKVTEYQLFVKEHSKRVRKDNPGIKLTGVMEILGREYREQKEKKGSRSGSKESTPDVDDLAKALKVVVLD